MDKYKEKLQQRLESEDIQCLYCKSKDIGMDNWGMFEGEGDWFYYCRECDETFTSKQIIGDGHNEINDFISKKL